VSSGTVLIATSENLAALKQLTAGNNGEVLAFPDTDALRALDVITRERPGVVALERLFAATSRGAALINRIKADPALHTCEIRIVTHETNQPGPPTWGPPSAAPALAAPGLAAPETQAPAKAPLDQRGTRRAPRFRLAQDVDLSIDGNAAHLVDVSVIGAQVVSSSILKPNQRVRVSLPDAPRPIRFSAGIAWASFEMPKGKPAPQYRAGLEFLDADPAAMQRFIDARKK
jgi:hypothetical protein